jgi:copper chaperone CopZ
MKTSVIEVRDMLSVLSVDEVEKRIGEVPGVESVTVNNAAGSATVRYDETRAGRRCGRDRTHVRCAETRRCRRACRRQTTRQSGAGQKLG